MGWVRGGHNGKKEFALKCISGKIKCFKTIFFFLFLMETRVLEAPPSQLNGKFHYLFFFFETTPKGWWVIVMGMVGDCPGDGRWPS